MMFVGLPKLSSRPGTRLRKRSRALIDAILRSAYRRYGRGKYVFTAVKHCLG